MKLERVAHRLLLSGVALAIVAGCSSSSRAPRSDATVNNTGKTGNYQPSHRDGAPWWDVDVSRIPEAVPTPHYGQVKANPYTVLGQTYFPISDARGYSAVGTASWYGTKFHGQATANGEEYDLYGMTAAHKTLPLPCYVKVTNLDNGRSVILRVNDRGPFYSERVIDLSFAAAKKLGYAERGTARVKVEGIDPQQWWAERGQPVPMVLAQPQRITQPATIVAASQPVESYTPPPQQHAAAILPVEVHNAAAQPQSDGLFIQVGAFANPDAAELLKDKLSGMVSAPVFISSVVRNQQVFHRVRLGPVDSVAQATQLENSVRLARLGEPHRVKSD